MPRSAGIVVAACAASAGAHAGLVPQHLDHEPRLGIAFIVATAMLLASAAALSYRPDDATLGHATTLVLATSIGAYALNATTGVPWLSDGREAVDLVGVATKSVEAVGLRFSIRLTPTRGGRGSPMHKEARP
jgi:hypothetical protein